MIRASLLGSVISVQALLIVCVLVESRAFAPPPDHRHLHPPRKSPSPTSTPYLTQILTVTLSLTVLNKVSPRWHFGDFQHGVSY